MQNKIYESLINSIDALQDDLDISIEIDEDVEELVLHLAKHLATLFLGADPEEESQDDTFLMGDMDVFSEEEF